MYSDRPAIVLLQNVAASLYVDLYGGAFTAFRIMGNNTNPLSFNFKKEEMPENNRQGAPYQGHFACIGRWGEPSPSEIKAGIPNHGEPANILWRMLAKKDTFLSMQTLATKEGLHVDRSILMDDNAPLFRVTEVITNVHVLGRLYNVVQHPTIAAPFLTTDTIVDCNASVGFNQHDYKQFTSSILNWPVVQDQFDNDVDLRNPQTASNAVYSFLVNTDAEYGWITSYSPQHCLLFGYTWKRTDYPWIHLWQHFDDDKIRYRGLEFGTAGIHQPFNKIIETGSHFFGEKLTAYIDAGESVTKKFYSFICNVGNRCEGVKNIVVINNAIIIKPKLGAEIVLKTQLLN